MKKFLLSLAMIITLSTMTLRAEAASITVSVDGQSGPWVESANPDYLYGGYGDYGEPNYNLPPTIINSSSGLPMTPGDKFTIQYVSGLVAGGVGLWSDAGGYSSYTGDGGPYYYTDRTAPGILEEMIGVFADSSGVIVGQPFVVGNGPKDVIMPKGASQLQLGFNDGWFNDNGGSLTAQVTETPTPESSSLLLGIMGICGLFFVRRKKRLIIV